MYKVYINYYLCIYMLIITINILTMFPIHIYHDTIEYMKNKYFCYKYNLFISFNNLIYINITNNQLKTLNVHILNIYIYNT